MSETSAVSILFRRFLVLAACPPEWARLDLYLIRDGELAFYAGQSECAYDRLWEHIRGGVHGHSIPGRFLLANWPRSGSFLVDLFSSSDPAFAGVGNNRSAAERVLIETWAPCFNLTLNAQPHPLPEQYRPVNAPLKRLVSYKRMLREAKMAARRDAGLIAWGEG